MQKLKGQIIMTVAEHKITKKTTPLLKVKTGLKAGFELKASISSEGIANTWNSIKSTFSG